MRAQFSPKYTSSTQKPNRKLLGFLAAAAAGLIVLPNAKGSDVLAGRPSADGVSQDHVQIDTWEEIACALFQFLLQRALLNPPPSLDPKSSAQVSAITFDKAYAASGIRTGLSQAEEDDILEHIRQLDSHLRSAPDQLGPVLQITTLGTLRAMYIEYGGDPDDLGG